MIRLDQLLSNAIFVEDSLGEEDRTRLHLGHRGTQTLDQPVQVASVQDLSYVYLVKCSKVGRNDRLSCREPSLHLLLH